MVSECLLFHFFEAMNTLSVEPLQGFSKLVQEGIRGVIFIIFSVNDLCSNLPRHRQIIKSLLKQKMLIALQTMNVLSVSSCLIGFMFKAGINKPFHGWFLGIQAFGTILEDSCSYLSK